MRLRMLLPIMLAAGPAAPAAAQHLRIGTASDPKFLDPRLSRSVAARQVFAAMCGKLVDIGEKLEVMPQPRTRTPTLQPCSR